MISCQAGIVWFVKVIKGDKLLAFIDIWYSSRYDLIEN